MKNKYTTYEDSLLKLNIQSLEERRLDLNLKFAKQCTKNEKFKNLFPENEDRVNTRHKEKYSIPHCNTNWMKQSSLIQLKHLLNIENETEIINNMADYLQFILFWQLIVVICFIF